MIFRGDGKNNIIEGDCFAKWLETTTNRDGETIAEYLQKDSNERIPPITKVLMNPPFPKKKTDKKEFLFIEQALKQMQDGMLLFSVLPYSCLVKSGSYLSWRKRLLANNTILAVVTFPEDLFYPVGVHTLGIFIKKGVPYERGSNVLWVRALNDGLLKRKGRRLPNVKATNDFTKIKEDLKKFLKKQDHEIKNIPRFSKLCPIDCKDKMLELVPENYLDDTIPTIDEIRVDIDKMIRGSVSFLVAHNLEDIVDAPV